MLLLEKILKERGMTILDLEARMKSRGTKLSRLSISKIINNVSSPKLCTLEDIAKTLDVDVRDLFNPTKEAEAEPTSTPLYTKDEQGNDKVVGSLKVEPKSEFEKRKWRSQ